MIWIWIWILIGVLAVATIDHIVNASDIPIRERRRNLPDSDSAGR